VLHDLVERTRHRVEGSQVLDQPVAPLHRFAALHRLSVAEHRAGREVAVAVGVLLEELCRKRMPLLEVVWVISARPRHGTRA
jgi:hypothetical protein